MNDIDDKSEILRLIRYIHEAREMNDFDSLIKKTTKDFNGFGTNNGEIFLNWNDRYRNFTNQQDQQSEDNAKLIFDFEKINVSLIDQNAAFSMSFGNVILTSPKGKMEGYLRETIIFKKINNEWMICHQHWSVPFIGSEREIPDIDSISENISKWLEIFENEITIKQLKDQNKKKKLIEYLKQAKVLLDDLN